MDGEMSGLNRLFADRVYGPQPTRDDRSGRNRHQFDPHPARKATPPPDAPEPAPGEEEATAQRGAETLGKIIDYEA